MTLISDRDKGLLAADTVMGNQVTRVLGGSFGVRYSVG